MACEDKVLLQHAYLDGELDLVHTLELEEYLKAPDAQRLEDERTLEGALRAGGLYHRSPRAPRERVRTESRGKHASRRPRRLEPALSSRGPASRRLGGTIAAGNLDRNSCCRARGASTKLSANF